MCEHLCEYLCGHLCRCVRQMVLQASTTAQLIRPSMSPLSLPTLNPGATSSIVIADLVNADGAVDVVIASSNGTLVLAGSLTTQGTFVDRTASAFPTLSPSCVGLAVSDVDNDGSVDVLCCAGPSAPAALLHFGGLPCTVVPLPALYCTAAAFGDVDNDGDVDVAATNGTSTTLYVNDGNGTLRAVAAFPSSYALAFVDVNGDGALDLPATLALSPLPGVAMVRAWSSRRVALFEPTDDPKVQLLPLAVLSRRRRVCNVFLPGAWW